MRPGEELDWDRLTVYLRPRLNVDGDLSVLQFPNGSANLTYLLSFTSSDDTVEQYVLRRPPFGQIAPGAHDMRREFRVLSRLWQHYDRAPRSYLLCDDHQVVGSDFVVSEYRRGEVVWGELPDSMTQLPDAGRRIGLATIDALADLHLVDAADCGLGDLGRPEGYVGRQLAGWRHRWELVATADHDAPMTATAEALGATLPASSRHALLHNDFKPDNCQFLPGRPDRVSAVFDWDMATLGDPLVDLGVLLNYWPDPSDSPDDRAWHVAGMERFGLPTRLEVVDRYQRRTGFDTATISWYEAFACWRMCVVLQQLHQRHVRGESSDGRMATIGDDIGMLARRAARILGIATP